MTKPFIIPHSFHKLEHRTMHSRSTRYGFFRNQKDVSVAMFNVRSINDLEKHKSLSEDLLCYGVDICCVQETKIKEDLDRNVGQYRLLNLEAGPHHGLGFFIHEDLD